MKVAALSDMHGQLVSVPDCDLVLIAGDVCPHGAPIKQAHWIDTEFRSWVHSAPATVIWIAGNHDWPLVTKYKNLIPMIPGVYLRDEIAEFSCAGQSYTVFGSPFTKRFGGWAFMKQEPELEEHFSRVIPKADIYVMHSPPYTIGDLSPLTDTHEGSLALLEKVYEYHPKLVVFGHIHSGHGLYTINESIAANVAIVDEQYDVAYEPMVFDI